jgi:CheY-like chemotaxis protein
MSEIKSVLIIDDDTGLHAMLTPVLKKAGYDTYSALTGEQGIKEAGERHPDLILLDVILPGIKGREVCAQLKQDEATREIPILFLTSKNHPDDVEAELKAGAIGHMTKPINSQSLLSEIQRVIG